MEYIVSYDEEYIAHCIYRFVADSEEEAIMKAKKYMQEYGIGYHYCEDFFRVSEISELTTIK